MQNTHYKIKYKLQSITHFGSHIGRDIEVVITSLPAIDFSKKKRVFPDSVTNFNEEIGVTTSNEKKFSLPIKVRIIEHDSVHNDIGETDYELTIDYAKETITTDKITVYVTKKRWYFWKKQAKFEVLLVTEIDRVVTEGPDPIPPKRIPTVDDPKWTGDFSDDTEQMILARALFGEARNTLVPDSIRYAIAWVIRNRVESSGWPNSYVEVITTPKHFSAFNSWDENRDNIENPIASGNSIDIEAWKHAYRVAGEVLSGQVVDMTAGANHYYDDSMSPPPWAKDMGIMLQISYTNEFDRLAIVYFLKS